MKLVIAVAVLCTSICLSKAKQGCGGKPADVIFVLDSSASIGKEDFRKQIMFTKDVVDIFDIGKDKMRVGITLFSTEVYPVFGLTTFVNKKAMERAIEQIYAKVGGTSTDKALKYVRETEFAKNARPKVPKIAIVLTDGQSYDRNKTIQEAYLAHASGITIFVIGIGDAVDKTELSALASDPDSSYLFHIGNYSALEKIKDTLAIETCKVEYLKPTPSPKLADKQIDESECILNLVVGADTNGVGHRNTRNILEFISEVTGKLLSRPGKLRTSQLMTECAGSSGLVRSKSYAPLIKKMRYQMATKSRLVKSVGLLFINSKIDDVSKAKSEVRRAKYYGFSIIVVDIGQVADREDIARLIGVKSSSADFEGTVFTVSGYSKLSAVQENVAKAVSRSGKCT